MVDPTKDGFQTALAHGREMVKSDRARIRA